MGVAVAIAFRLPEQYLPVLTEQLKPDIPKTVLVCEIKCIYLVYTIMCVNVYIIMLLIHYISCALIRY